MSRPPSRAVAVVATREQHSHTATQHTATQPHSHTAHTRTHVHRYLNTGMHRAQNSRSIVSPVCSSRGVTSQNIGCVWVSGFRASGLGAEFRGVQGTRTHSAHGRSACLKLPRSHRKPKPLPSPLRLASPKAESPAPFAALPLCQVSMQTSIGLDLNICECGWRVPRQ